MIQELDQITSRLFRAYDIRGDIELLTETMVRKIAKSLVLTYQSRAQNQIIIGYDARPSSVDYAKILIEQFASSGFDVTCAGLTSTPTLFFGARFYQGNGIMVTASHNPAQHNGIKWIVQGEPPTSKDIQMLAKQDINQLTKNERGQIFYQDLQTAYEDALLSDIHFQHRFSVALDGMHGSAGANAKRLLTQLGCDVTAIRCETTGDFPPLGPDPSQAENLKLLKSAVLKQHAQLGIALDGDGDRLVLLDEDAKVISPDYIIAICAQICLQQQRHSKIIFDVKCSQMLAEIIASYGGRAEMIRTGSPFLRRALNDDQASFGGEFSGHYVFSDGRGFGIDDGIYAALRIMEWLSVNGISLKQAVAKLPKRFATPDMYLPLNGLNVEQMLQKLMQQQPDHKAILTEVDGLRLDFADGFGLLRASNTGDFLTARFDADSPGALSRIQNIFSNWLAIADQRMASLIQAPI